jgi:hypothetical protein
VKQQLSVWGRSGAALRAGLVSNRDEFLDAKQKASDSLTVTH